MKYIIFDLEFNQGYKIEKEYSSNIKCPFEIIQIGAIKLNENFSTIDTFNALVKPEIYTDLNPFVKNITTITIESLNKAKTFKELYEDFIQFLNEDKCVLCIWGMADLKELFRNTLYHKLDINFIPREYINLQTHAGKYLNCPKSTNIGLSTAVQLLNIPENKTFHDAFHDAYYTAEVFKKIYSKKIKHKIYSPMEHINSTRFKSIKTKLDTGSLFKQFEKMFNRKLSDEEESLIKLAYMMGKTNQFQIETPTKQKN